MANKISYTRAKRWLASLPENQQRQVRLQLDIMRKVSEVRGALVYLAEKWTHSCVRCNRLITREEMCHCGLCELCVQAVLRDGHVDVGGVKIAQPS